MKILFRLLFAICAIGLVAAALLDTQLLYRITKPALIPLLGIYYTLAIAREHRSIVVLLALACSFAGDVFLMDAAYFVQGLVAFLAAHLCYIVAYRHHREDESTDAITGLHRVRLSFPVILAASGLVVVLFPALGPLRIPVIIYATVLCTMVLVALFRYGRTGPVSFWMIFVGALLFMVSDSILAINKFLNPVVGADALILSTYAAAQFLIVEGLIRHGQPR